LNQRQRHVSDRRAVKRLFEEAIGNLRGLDALVSNAGVAGPRSKVEEMNPEDDQSALVK
jgi:NAD(P)-dependent dehydrogenase (short-subunit alcohol dehydrogenase family)